MILPPSDELTQHAPAIRAFSAALCRQDSDASDVAQSAMMLALEERSARRGPLRGWLRGAARLVARERYRSEARRNQREAEVAASEAVPSAAERAARLEIEAMLIGWVRELPAEQSEAVHLRFWEGLAPRDIAAQLGVPVDTVKTRLKRGLGRLRDQLSAQTPGGEARWIGILGPMPLGWTNQGAAGVASGWIGGMLMKKAMTAAAAVLVAWGTWSLLPKAPPPMDPPPAGRTAPLDQTTVLSQPTSDQDRVAAGGSPGAPSSAAQPTPTGRVVFGRVVNVGSHSEDAQGAAAAGVTVRLNWGWSIGPDAATTVTDVNGGFRMEVPENAHRDLIVSVSGDGRYRQASSRVKFAANETGERSCLVTRYLNGGLMGKVTDLDQRPIEGVLVTINPDGGEAHQQALEIQTDDEGRFHLAQLGAYRSISFQAPGWTMHSRSNPRQSSTGEWEEMDVLLARCGSLTVRLLDGSGTPLPDVRITVTPSAAEPLGTQQRSGQRRDVKALHASTDESGTAVVEGVWAGQKLLVRAWLERQSWSWERQGPGSPAPGTSIQLAEPGADPITFRIGFPRHLAGTVIDADDRPVPKGTVLLRSYGPDGEDPSKVGINLETDENGRFRFDYFASAETGNGKLSAWDTEYWKLQQGIVRTPGVASREVDLRQSADEIVLKLAPTREISGIVTDKEGAPIRAWIEAIESRSAKSAQANPAHHDKGRLRNGVTNRTIAKPSGQFRLGGLPEGRYTLRVSQDSYAGQTLTGIEAGTSGLEVKLDGPPECTLHIEVIAPANIEMAEVFLQTAAVRGDLPGSRDLPDLPARATYSVPGHCILPGAGSNGYQGIDSPLGLVETTTLPIQGAIATRGVRSGPGWVAVKATAKNGERLYPVGTGHLELTEGEHHLRFELRRSGSISGRVRSRAHSSDPPWSPGPLFVAFALPSGELLELAGRGVPKTALELGARGDFQINWLPTGDYELRVGTAGTLARGESETSTPIHVTPGPNKPLMIGPAKDK